jgi:predicted DNA-binding protein (MmcQ/YjbR family)
MNHSALRTYCLAKPGAVETFPFGEEVRVYKVGNKIFGLHPVEKVVKISLKCDPMLAEILRKMYPAVRPGYHLNKTHWNTVTCDGSLPDAEIFSFVDYSYDLIVKSLTRAVRKSLGFSD